MGREARKVNPGFGTLKSDLKISKIDNSRSVETLF